MLSNAIVFSSMASHHSSIAFPFNACLVVGLSSSGDGLSLAMLKKVAALLTPPGYCRVMFSRPRGVSHFTSVVSDVQSGNQDFPKLFRPLAAPRDQEKQFERCSQTFSACLMLDSKKQMLLSDQNRGHFMIKKNILPTDQSNRE